jgi:peptidoglycan/LPS O-acetylase OafA/YrhL
MMPFDPHEKRSQGSVHMDAIRGLAAILVMLGHSRDLFFSSLNTKPNSGLAPAGVVAAHHVQHGQITLGNEAVMIFFILSGYLVGGSVLRAFRRNRWSWKDYLTKRLTRLWVVLLPALVLSVALDSFGLHLFPEATSIYRGPSGQTEVSAHLVQTLTPGTIAGNAVFLQTIVVPVPGTNIALWSLSNEFWYYLIFPLLVLALWPNRSVRVRLLCLLLAGGLLFFIGVPIAVLFPTWLLGVAIAMVPLRLSYRVSSLLSVVLSLLLLPVMVLTRRLPLDLVVAQTCIALYFGVLLYVLLNRTKPARPGLYPRIATVLSNLSYPLYLVHLPILVLLCAFVNRPWHQWTKTPGHFVVMFALDFSTLIVAYIFHLAFQQHTEAIRLYLIGKVQHQQHVPTATPRMMEP